MTSHVLLGTSTSSSMIKESQNQEVDSDCTVTVKKIAYYVGKVFLGLGIFILAVMIGSSATLCPFFFLSPPVLGAAYGIGCAVAIPSILLGRLLIQPYQYILNEQRLQSCSLTDLTSIGAWSEGVQTARAPLVFGWNEVIQYYGGVPSHRTSICSFLKFRSGKKNFDQLKARIQREIKKTDKPFIYAHQLTESLTFTAKNGQLSVDETKVKQMVLKALQDRIQNLSTRELIACFSFNEPLDRNSLNGLYRDRVISEPLHQLLSKGLDVQIQLEAEIAQIQTEFLKKEKTIQEVTQVISRSNQEVAQGLDALSTELEALSKSKEQTICALQEKAEEVFAAIDQSLRQFFNSRSVRE